MFTEREKRMGKKSKQKPELGIREVASWFHEGFGKM